MNRRLFLTLIPVTLAAGCGFQLRRMEGIPFASLYIEAAHGSAVAQRVRTMLNALKYTGLTTEASEAEAVLKISEEERKKTILSLSGAGRVTENRLSLHLVYSVSGRGGRILAAPETIDLISDMSYDDSELLAKDAEEQLLYRDINSSAALRIVRRLQALKPGNGS